MAVKDAGAVDTINKSKIGGWRSASLIIRAEIGETVANQGIASNLINFLTGPLCQSTVVAAANVNGLGLLTLSVLLPSHECGNNAKNNASLTSPSFQVIFFFFSLYLVAVGKAGFKPCAEAFGADQFNGRNPEESESKSSFFNWWYFGLCVGSSFSLLILTYIQDNLSWALGFGIPCIFLAVALLAFFFGRKTYRHSVKQHKENPIQRITRVFIAAAKNWRTASSSADIQLEEAIGMPPHICVGAHQFKFLDKALIDISNVPVDSRKNNEPCSLSQVEDAKVVLRLVPIWITCLIYAVVVAQSPTFLTKQGSTMERLIGLGIQIPPALLQALISLSIILFIPIYDRVFMPLAQAFTRKPNGITMLQRIGADFGLIDMPTETVPMSVWWLVSQYFLLGLTEVFTMVGLQEFVYDQVPDGLRSMGVSFYLSIFGTGNFLSGFLISIIEKLLVGAVNIVGFLTTSIEHYILITSIGFLLDLAQ
ncbi:Proton-dependent oligopeptide transporter family [Macleaya cordata]|uniref:Proton-dependent oligopeptide transporter family n=1 Tax=Macleaya cordata TaxID=56857 RepID=A0A200QZJ0_MACCD|nr:Proton-dependent oligopeptide transporter family [Macleaya cordata]